jgi:hypothetical protein
MADERHGHSGHADAVDLSGLERTVSGALTCAPDVEQRSGRRILPAASLFNAGFG